MRISTLLTALSTAVIGATILLGGLVHATGSGLACPDWPLCFGQVMPAMQGAVLIEHSHRMIAGSAGILIWLTGLSFWFDEQRTTAEHWIIVTAMVLVVIQSVFGGLTVLMELPDWVSTTHFALAHLTLLAMVILCWSSGQTSEPRTSNKRKKYDEWLLIVGFVFIFLQMILGAWLRHIGTKGAPFQYSCDTFPFCDPVWTKALPGYYSLSYWGHRYFAVGVTIILVYTAYRFFTKYRQTTTKCYHLTLINACLVYVQILLGVLTVRAFLAVVPVTLHLTTAVVLFVSQAILVLEFIQPKKLIYPTQ